MSLIVIASMGASAETVEFIENVFFEIYFVGERENIGRIQIEKVVDADKEIIKILNQEIAQI